MYICDQCDKQFKEPTYFTEDQQYFFCGAECSTQWFQSNRPQVSEAKEKRNFKEIQAQHTDLNWDGGTYE